MSGFVNYEVYLNQNGGWDIVGRYPANRSEAALEEAKRLEFVHKKPVKVVRETFEEDTQLFREKLIYITHSEPTPAPAQRQTEIRKVRGNLPQKKKPEEPKKEKKTVRSQSFVAALAMLGSAMFSSLIGAAAMTLLLLQVLPKTNSFFSSGVRHFSIVAFVFFFLFLSLPLTAYLVNWNVLFGMKNKKKDKKTAAKTTNADVSALIAENDNEEKRRKFFLSSGVPSIFRHLFDFFDTINGRKTMSERIMEEEERNAPPQEEEETPPETAEEIDYGDDGQEEQKDPAEQTAQEGEETEETPEDEEEEEDSDNDGAPVLSTPLTRCNLQLTAFLSLVLQHLKRMNVAMNSYICFGLELLIAGAIECIAREKNLTAADRRLLIRAQFNILGRKREVALLFFHKLEEYVLEPKYLPMIEGGNRGFGLYKENPGSEKLASLIQTLLHKWIAPDKTESYFPGIVTVMFTDIVESTSMTETMGDKIAQEIVRNHNIIVRKALSENNGEEIKHTGDGIMASFAQTSDALEASIAIRRNIARYNREMPSRPLRLRIGLNVGEPIAENNDLYGLTVQKAARICAEATENQILISAAVKDLAAGKNFRFTDAGEHVLKGFSEPQQLYAVEWEPVKNKNGAERKADESQPVEQPLEDRLPEF